ncbi:MAG: iron-sulfur cluster assembly scaffold protein [Acidobacteria bacterium]|nr:iron-sulfur cluster assembly scaffold protein [Acidobacteriota bacterium]
MPMFSARLLDHFQNPRNAGELEPPCLVVEVTNPACGDFLRLTVRVEKQRVMEARYKIRGCTASIAAGSALAEWLTGRTAPELLALSPGDIEAALDGLPAESKHAAVLCVDAAKALAREMRTARSKPEPV